MKDVKSEKKKFARYAFNPIVNALSFPVLLLTKKLRICIGLDPGLAWLPVGTLVDSDAEQ